MKKKYATIIVESMEDDLFCICFNDNQPVFSFEFHDMPYCCGMVVSVNIQDTINKVDSYGNTVDLEYIAKQLDKFLKTGLRGDKTNNKEIAYIIQLTNSEGCNFIREALIRTKIFTLIKTVTRNSETTSDIEIWIS